MRELWTNFRNTLQAPQATVLYNMPPIGGISAFAPESVHRRIREIDYKIAAINDPYP
jgi:hypothetical protein